MNITEAQKDFFTHILEKFRNDSCDTFILLDVKTKDGYNIYFRINENSGTYSILIASNKNFVITEYIDNLESCAETWFSIPYIMLSLLVHSEICKYSGEYCVLSKSKCYQYCKNLNNNDYELIVKEKLKDCRFLKNQFYLFKSFYKNKVDECCVCYEVTKSKTSCSHFVCIPCQINILNTSINSCPYCRKSKAIKIQTINQLCDYESTESESEMLSSIAIENEEF
jgi:hypothetical protein